MSHRGLQRALVVALHDPGFLDGPREQLIPFALAPAERAELLAVDRRALATDPLRTRRLLRTLTEEFKATSTLILARTRRLAALEAFFASPSFRAAVAQDGPLALALGEFLGDLAAADPDRRVAGVLEIELARARSRRPRPPVPGKLGLAPGVVVVQVPGGSLAVMQAVERWLFEVSLMPQALLCEDAPSFCLETSDSAPHHLLFSPGESDAVLSDIDGSLFAVLQLFSQPRSPNEAHVGLVDLGIPDPKVGSVLSGLEAEGLLVTPPVT